MLLLLLLTFCFSLPSSAAKTDSVRVYTEEHPLVYVDNSHLWPYSFLNDKDEPEGFCVDLVRMLMEELNIPYVIKLEPEREVFNDMKEGRGDLTFGLAMGFNNDYGNFGSRAITLLTQSVVTPRSKPIEIKSFRDMNKPGLKVIVSNSSLCHHLMRDYGWGEHAVVTHDMDEAILQLSKKKEGQISDKENQIAALQDELSTKQKEADALVTTVETQVDRMLVSVKKEVSTLNNELSGQITRENHEESARIASIVDKVNSSVLEIKDYLAHAEEDTSLEDMKEELSEKIHSENVKVFRNIQDTMKEMDHSEQLDISIDEKYRSLKHRSAFLLIVLIINLIVSAVILLMNAGIIPNDILSLLGL